MNIQDRHLPTVANLKMEAIEREQHPQRSRNNHARVASQLTVMHDEDVDRKLFLQDDKVIRNELTPKAMRSRNTLLAQRDTNA